MQEEIEVKFLNVDFDDVRRKLKEIGGKCKQPMRLMKRSVMDFSDQRLRDGEGYWSWIRIRDEGERVTVTFKQVAKEKSLQTHEIEYEASSYDAAVATFEAVGLKRWSEQESKRETWQVGDSEVMLDEWPWIPPFVELEGSSDAALRELATKLDFRWEKHLRGGSDEVYRLHFSGMTEAETIGMSPKVTFAEMPQWLKDRQ